MWDVAAPGVEDVNRHQVDPVGEPTVAAWGQKASPIASSPVAIAG